MLLCTHSSTYDIQKMRQSQQQQQQQQGAAATRSHQIWAINNPLSHPLRARLLTRSRASIAPIQPTTTTAATTAAPKLRSWPLSSSLRYLGTVGGPQQTGRCKKQGCDWGAVKQGCDWGACGRTRRRDLGRPRRRDLATSLALRPRRGRTRTRARPSRLRAIAGRKPRDETRPSGGEMAEKRL